ncbi:MiaB/RimO family radical SAM methylthiotransferase [Tsuneonella sp. HG222]
MSEAQVISLGCRLNLAESERIRALLAGAPDTVVINSCAVTAEAVRQTRQAIRRARRHRPDARLLVTGCAAEIEREGLAAMPEVDGLVPNAAKLDARAWNVPDAPARPSQLHTRAFVAVQNGCDHACTFCVIPQGRGPSRSLGVAQVLREIEDHLALGAGEVVLTGVDVTSWGHDLPGSPRLGALVRAILDAFPQLARLRMSSLDGIEVDDELFALLAEEPRVMPHLHLSLQHGHDLVLKRMKRRHSRADAIALVERLRARRPDLAVGADLIAGFPTESGEHHAANLSIVRDLGIVHGHVFPYSRRPGTPAARMPQLEGDTIRQRAAELRDAVAAGRRRWLESLIGTPLTVLVEADGTGHAENFARVAAPGGTPRGAIIGITPTRLEEGLLS